MSKNEEPNKVEEEMKDEAVKMEENTTTEVEESTTEEATDSVKKKRKRGGRGGSKKQEGKVAELETTINELEDDMTAIQERLVVTQDELKESKDKYLRLYAEFDNYRKRTAREKLELSKVASQDLMKSILSSLDDFERAFKAAEQNEDERVPEGVNLVHEKFLKTLDAKGLVKMESTGEDFDSELHEAVTKFPAPTPELKGKVIDTIEAGYYLNEKIIRYAKVVIGE